MAPVVFEGPEKKIELMVVEDHPSLRSFGDAFWREVVEASRATVLSKASTKVFDAYLLSESSLFVYDEHITMITCGRTRLADAALHVLTRVPPEQVAFFALERKNEHFPHEQPSTFEQDARRLQQVLPGLALRFGDAHGHQIQVFHSTRPFAPDPLDTTLEVLMHGIDPEVAEAFHAGADRDEAVARARATGAAALLPGFEIDDFAFEPAGYSLNGLSGEIYYTIHVTPEQLGSYVSFETNVDFRADPTALVQRVVDVFRPEAFDVFAWAPDGYRLPLPALPGYALRKHAEADVSGYGVTFHHQFRPPAGPVAPEPIPLV